MNVNVLSDEWGVVAVGKKRNNDDGPGGVVSLIWVYLCCDVNTDQHHQRSNIQRRRLLGEHT